MHDEQFHARLWDAYIVRTEQKVEPPGFVKATSVLIETLCNVVCNVDSSYVPHTVFVIIFLWLLACG